MTERARKPAATYRSTGLVVLRTALFPVSRFLDWAKDVAAPHATGNALDAALAHDAQLLRTRLDGLVADTEFLEALAHASPSLSGDLKHWRTDPTSERGEKIERSLLRYFARACYRSTPFGYFAAWLPGTVGDSSRLDLGPRSQLTRTAKLDPSVFWKLRLHLEQSPTVREALRYFPNSSLTSSGGRLHFLEAHLVNGDGWSYRTVEVEREDHLDAVLAEARQGAPFPQLQKQLETSTGADAAEAREFLHSLIESQLLVSALEVPVTGADPLDHFCAELPALPECASVRATLQAVKEQLAQAAAAAPGASLEVERSLRERFAALQVPTTPGQLLRIDSFRSTEGVTLPRAVFEEMDRALLAVGRLASTSDPLTELKLAFRARYEMREVPLSEVLDPTRGLGLASSGRPSVPTEPLVAGLESESRAPPVQLTPAQWLLVQKLNVGAGGERVRTLTLAATDLERLPPAAPQPVSVSVYGRVLGASAEAVAAGDFTLRLEGYQAGVGTLGRIAGAHPGIRSGVTKHLREEEAQHPDALLVEVVHLAEAGGSLLYRPVLRDHELPYLGRSGAPVDQQLSLDDLHLSLVGDRFVLRSKRLGRRVLPRLSSAFAGSNSREPRHLFRFLLQLQNDQERAGWFDWGPLNDWTFLPRLVFGKTVLSPMKWRLGKRSFRAEHLVSARSRFEAVQAFRAKHQLPRHVVVGAQDQEVLVDLDAALSVETFLSLVTREESISVSEAFLDARELCIRGDDGAYTASFVAPLIRERTRPPPRAPVSQVGTLRRRFPPGSEWLVAKLYSHPLRSDELLQRFAADVLTPARAQGVVDRWFFLRNGDPLHHLRVRLHGEPAALRAHVEPRLAGFVEALTRDGTLINTQVDGYEREIERYGGAEAMVLAEQLFCADSDAFLTALPSIDAPAHATLRWQRALYGVHEILQAFAWDAPRIRAFCEDRRDRYRRELSLRSTAESVLSKRFRANRSVLEAHLAAPPPWPHRASTAKSVATGLVALEATGRLTLPLDEVVGSLIHMWMNRICRSEPHLHELAAFDFLARLASIPPREMKTQVVS